MVGAVAVEVVVEHPMDDRNVLPGNLVHNNLTLTQRLRSVETQEQQIPEERKERKEGRKKEKQTQESEG